jgi:hypothetical protein
LADAVTTIDFETNPENNGNADMDAAPTIQKRQVKGIVL